MSEKYEVMSPWAEAEPVSQKGISPRLNSLENKRIGFLRNSKRASSLILSVLEKKLKARFPSIETKSYIFLPNDDVAATKELPAFEEFLKGIDALILAYGD